MGPGKDSGYFMAVIIAGVLIAAHAGNGKVGGVIEVPV